MNTNHTILLLDRPKDDVVLGTLSPLPPPLNHIPLKLVFEVPGVQLIEDLPQVKIPALLSKGELPLHRQLQSRNFAFTGRHGEQTNNVAWTLNSPARPL